MKTRRIANNDYPGYEVYRSTRVVFNEPCYTLVAAAHCRSSFNGFVESYSRWPPIVTATTLLAESIGYSCVQPAKSGSRTKLKFVGNRALRFAWVRLTLPLATIIREKGLFFNGAVESLDNNVRAIVAVVSNLKKIETVR